MSEEYQTTAISKTQDSTYNLTHLNVPTFVEVVAHPVVFFNILDHHVRRENKSRVIGTLLGRKTGSVVEVLNSFPVPHEETDDMVQVDMEYHQRMFELHRQTYPDEEIVGWYATGDEITDHNRLIQDFFNGEVANNDTSQQEAVHLQMNTNIGAGSLRMKAFVGNKMDVEDQQIGYHFSEVDLAMGTDANEKLGLQFLVQNANAEFDGQKGVSTSGSDIDQLKQSLEKLYEMLAVAQEYVAAVKEGTIEGDEEIGALLLDAVSCVPTIDASTFEKTFSENVQDMLMLVYLSNLTKAQLAVSEKLLQLESTHQDTAALLESSA